MSKKKYCEWKEDKYNIRYFYSDCDKDYIQEKFDYFKYCPKCGKKIKIKEGK